MRTCMRMLRMPPFPRPPEQPGGGEGGNNMAERDLNGCLENPKREQWRTVANSRQ